MFHKCGMRQDDRVAFSYLSSQSTRYTGLSKPSLTDKTVKLCVSLYANNAVIFAKPKRFEISLSLSILHSGRRATGLHINLQKSTVAPIRCDDINLDKVLAEFGGGNLHSP